MSLKKTTELRATKIDSVMMNTYTLPRPKKLLCEWPAEDIMRGGKRRLMKKSCKDKDIKMENIITSTSPKWLQTAQEVCIDYNSRSSCPAVSVPWIVIDIPGAKDGAKLYVSTTTTGVESWPVIANKVCHDRLKKGSSVNFDL